MKRKALWLIVCVLMVALMGVAGAEDEGCAVHQFDYTKCIDNGDGQHGFPCRNCDALDLAYHYRDCTDPEGVCIACGAACDNIRVDHNNVDIDKYVDNGDGSCGHWCSGCQTLVYLYPHYHLCTTPEGVCSGCGAATSAKTLHNHSNSDDGNEMDLTVHEDNGDGTHSFHCNWCNQMITEDHDWFETITLEPTDTTPGLKVKECGYCERSEEEEIPALKPAADPQYTLSGITYDGSAITGSVAHVAGTAEVERLYVRVAVFLSNGSYMITVTEVDDDMTFEIGASGDFVYMAIVATGTKKSVQPGDWKVLGVYEQEF